MTLLRPLTALRGDSEGSVLAVFATLLAIFAGVVALSFDFGRLSATQSELQSFADNVALAAAGELDGQADAIERARGAAATLVADWQTYGDGANALGAEDFTLAFYSTRPRDDGSTPETTDPGSAGYVAVWADNRTVRPIFGAVFNALGGGSAGRSSVGAYAVAGFTSYACDISPMMFCAPNAAFRADDHIGHSVQLRLGGGNKGAWGAGAFGFLDPSESVIDPSGVCAGLTGAKLDICLISAIGNRSSCFEQRGVDIEPGQKVGNYEAALNVRFDIYHGGASKLRTDPAYAPAPNVLSGYGPAKGQCIGNSPVELTNVMGMPIDDCQVAGTCGRLGNGDWSAGRDAYVETNYGGYDPHPTATTRYEYYLAEIEAAKNATGPLDSIFGDLTLPTCAPAPSPNPNRRLFVAASIDCVGNVVKAGAKDLPVLEYVEVFMIAPIGLDGTKDVVVEIVGGVGGGTGGNDADALIRDVVQLYE